MIYLHIWVFFAYAQGLQLPEGREIENEISLKN